MAIKPDGHAPLTTNTDKGRLITLAIAGLLRLVYQRGLVTGAQLMPFVDLFDRWVSGTAYKSNDLVRYNGSLWRSTAESNESEPGAVGADWVEFV